MNERDKDRPNLVAKWGEDTLMKHGGWTAVPNALIRNSGRLGLDPTETLVLIYLTSYWWNVDSLPYPSISKASEGLGVTRKTMTKKFASLQEKGFIKLVTDDRRRRFSLEGLRVKLNSLTAAGEDELELPEG